jgi:hypothetical protein
MSMSTRGGWRQETLDALSDQVTKYSKPDSEALLCIKHISI